MGSDLRQTTIILPDAAEGATPLTGVVSTASRRIREEDDGGGDEEEEEVASESSLEWWPEVQ